MAGKALLKREFAQEVLSVLDGDGVFDTAYFTRRSKISDIDSQKTTNEWIPFEEWHKQQGFALAVAQMKAGTVSCRRHTGLTDGCDIKWPYDQEVRKLRKIDTQETRTTDEVEEVKSCADDDQANLSQRFAASHFALRSGNNLDVPCTASGIVA